MKHRNESFEKILKNCLNFIEIWNKRMSCCSCKMIPHFMLYIYLQVNCNHAITIAFWSSTFNLQAIQHQNISKKKPKTRAIFCFEIVDAIAYISNWSCVFFFVVFSSKHSGLHYTYVVVVVSSICCWSIFFADFIQCHVFFTES